MKKVKKFNQVLSKGTAEEVAKGLTKSMGLEKAFKTARSNALTLAGIGIGDVNEEFFDIKHIQKQARFWKHVQDVLAKSETQSGKLVGKK